MNYAPSLSSSATEIQELVQQNNSTIVELQGYFLFNISQCLVLDQYFHASRRCLADINAELNSIKIELQFEKPFSSSKFYSSASEGTRYSSNLEKKRIKIAKYEAALDQLEWQASRFPTPQEIQFRVMPAVSVFQDSEIHGNIVNFITGFRSGDVLWYSSDRSKVERKVALSSYVPSGRGAASLSDSQSSSSSSSSSSDSPKKPATTSTSTQKVHFNREGCIEAASVSALAWVPHSSSPTVGDGGQFLVGHTNGLMYLYHFDRKDPPPELVQVNLYSSHSIISF
jgi:hypothetical protein